MTEKIVKSVQRVFEVLELFSIERRPLSGIEVSQRLHYPLTSTHAILKSMQALGYLKHNAQTKTFFPSQTLSNVISWSEESIQGELEIIDFLKALSNHTRETINISRRSGAHVKIIFGLECKHPFGVNVRTGSTMPVTGSLTGISSLSGLTGEIRANLINNIKNTDQGQAAAINEKLINRIIADLNKYGLASHCDLYIKGIGSICVPIVSKTSEEPLVVGIVGPSDRINAQQEQYRKYIFELVDRFNIQTLFPLKSQSL